MKPSLLILAAGMGSRYGSLKQIDGIGPSGEAIIDYSIYDAIRAGFQKVSFIIRESIEKEFREVFEKKLEGRIETEFIFQELDMVPPGVHYSPDRVKPWGTAHAVWVAKDHIDSAFVAINADDFYGSGSYKAMAEYLSGEDGGERMDFCMMGYRVGETLSEHGSVSRGVCQSKDGGFLASVVERTEISIEGDEIYFLDENRSKTSLNADILVSMNIWGFTPAVFDHLERAFTGFIGDNADKPKAELYIPDVVNELVSTGKARVRIIPATDKWFGVTYKEDKPMAVERIRSLIKQGVYPEKLWA
jgi:NDP-sugar pyrophosphorylase family protein